MHKRTMRRSLAIAVSTLIGGAAMEGLAEDTVFLSEPIQSKNNVDVNGRCGEGRCASTSDSPANPGQTLQMNNDGLCGEGRCAGTVVDHSASVDKADTEHHADAQTSKPESNPN